LALPGARLLSTADGSRQRRAAALAGSLRFCCRDCRASCWWWQPPGPQAACTGPGSVGAGFSHCFATTAV